MVIKNAQHAEGGQRPFALSLADFACSPQEVLLAQRHGRRDEEVDNPYLLRQHFYRYLAAASGREIRFSFRIRARDLLAEVAVDRVYHHDGCLRRIMQLPLKGAKYRQGQIKPHERWLLQLAGYACSKHFSGAPKKLQYVIHSWDAETQGVPISRLVDVEPLPENEVLEKMRAFLDVLAQARWQSDGALPLCDDDQRHCTTTGVPMKCLHYCRARHVCRQLAQYLERATFAVAGMEISPALQIQRAEAKS
jgi:hypothetical protein